MVKTVMITGATSGIGRSVTYLLAEKGFRLLLIAKSEEKLEILSKELVQTFSIECTYYCIDLRNRSQVINFLEEGVDTETLIHCAGVGKLGDFKTVSFEEEEELYQVNILASILFLKTYANRFVNRDYGVMAVICSTGAFYPHPFLNSYASSKAFLYHYCLGLSEEIKRYSQRVKIIAISPGPTKTNFFKKQIKEKMVRGTMDARFEMSAKQVAERIIRTLDSDELAVTIGIRNRLLTKVIQCMPLKLRIKIVGKYIGKGEEHD